jgi:hypothetical protein
MPYVWLPVALAMLRGIEPYEVMQVLYAKRRLPVPGRSGDVPIIAICGRTNAGRPLAVAVRRTGRLNQEIVGARDLNPDELARFEHWEAEQDD